MKKRLGILLLVILAACKPPEKQTFSQPEDKQDGIQTGNLQEAGFNLDSISELISGIETGYYPNRHSLLIYKNGKLVLEKYFRGHDEDAWANKSGVVEHGTDSLHDIRSITKSVVSACVGIAIAKGKIKGVDQKVFDFFPEYKSLDTGAKNDWTIEHLLTMSTGLKWNEEVPYNNPENSEIQMSMAADPIAFVLSQPLVAKPGTVWNYNGGTTQLLAQIVQKATGQIIIDFAQENLFSKLGINKYHWAKLQLQGKEIAVAASGLRLRSRDILKFAMLYQQNGEWNGEQLFPPHWVDKSFSFKVSRGDAGGYGYQFWIFNDNLNGKTITLASAVGNGDQRIFFDKQNDIIVVMTAGNYNKWDIKNNAHVILRRIYGALEK